MPFVEVPEHDPALRRYPDPPHGRRHAIADLPGTATRWACEWRERPTDDDTATAATCHYCRMVLAADIMGRPTFYTRAWADVAAGLGVREGTPVEAGRALRWMCEQVDDVATLAMLDGRAGR